MLHIVEAVALSYPTEFAQAHRHGYSRTEREAFIRRVAWELNLLDTSFGLNGKRGTDELSQDAVSYITSRSPAGGVEIIDVISGAGGPGARVAWQDVTQATIDAGTVGRFIPPTRPDLGGDQDAPAPPSQAGPRFDHEWFATTLADLESVYRAELYRTFVLDGRLDAGGIALRYAQRAAGVSLDQITDEIRRSHEWKVKHESGSLR
jgi:hypothetical protein